MQDGDNLSQSLRYRRHSVVFDGVNNMKMMHHVCTLSRRDYLKCRENTKHSYSGTYKHNGTENSQEGIHYPLSAFTIISPSSPGTLIQQTVIMH